MKRANAVKQSLMLIRKNNDNRLFSLIITVYHRTQTGCGLSAYATAFMNNTSPSLLRTVLNKLYVACGAIAALFLLAILGIIVAQMLCRWLGIAFPGSTNYAAYCMAASSFFGLAYALNRNAHIRVSLLLNVTKGTLRRILDLWCLAIAVLLSAYFTYYAVRNVRLSRLIHDVSQGQDATPLWIPQLSLAIGAGVFCLALLDHLVCTLRHKDHTFDETPHDEGEF